MSTLEEIKARAEKATPGPWEFDADCWLESGDRSMDYVLLPGAYSSDEVQRVVVGDPDADFIAHARTDVPKLIAALEAVGAVLADRATGFRETSDRLNQQVLDRDPGMDAETAHRYAIHAQSSESALRMIQRTIKEALA